MPTSSARRRSGGPKVYISADMEGIGGVSTWSVQAGTKGREYEKFRRLMTLEVNAAVEGAFDAGASEVLVSDSHGDAQNLDVELLDRRVALVRAWPRPLGMMQGIDESFDAAAFVGYHGREGEGDALLAHTFTGWMSVKLNDESVPEAGFNAAIAGQFGVPVVFLSGDQTICADARRLLGPIETAAVKRATGYFSAAMTHPEECRRMIRDGMRRGIERREEIQPFRPSPPLRLDVVSRDVVRAELASYLPGSERVDGTTVRFRPPDMAQASRLVELLSSLRAPNSSDEG
jgi:D-amino peptidase